MDAISKPHQPNPTGKAPMSIWVKAMILAVITVGLLIPLFMTYLLVSEREETASKAVQEVSAKWGGDQVVLSPTLVVQHQVVEVNDEGKKVERTRQQWLFPRKLSIKATADTRVKKRSIYEIPIYEATIDISGEWHLQDLPEDLVLLADDDGRLLASALIGLADVKGIKEVIALKIDGQDYRLSANSQSTLSDLYHSTWDDLMRMSIPEPKHLFSTPYPVAYDRERSIPFSATIRLAGTRSLGFCPTGGATDIALSSNWHSPSFGGSFLPDSSNISQSGFDASWRVLDYNRGYSTSLDSRELQPVVSSPAMVSFIEVVNQYTQVDRSLKYGILFILLAFVTLFFVEMALKGREPINVFHYILTGLALVLFYTLLLSLSEIIGFGWAYLLATAMILALLGGYFLRLLPERRYVVLLIAIMGFLYLLAYLLIQMTTYALLAGSLGLFVILGAIMYFSSKLIK